MSRKSERSAWSSGGYIGLGIALGAGFGVPFDSIPIGAVVGLLGGVIVTGLARAKSD
ncbi:hypothetical protein [Novosphingobium sp. M1R2S20]|uniref:Glycine zipper-like domain-containing protein n=1 Tax=Novosphingobium rhizovicinum TaxID=3228928 RepID=A0ABV3REL5_9SPHN